MDRALAGALPHLRDAAQGLGPNTSRFMQPNVRKRVHIALLLLLAMAFYGGFIFMQWVRSGT